MGIFMGELLVSGRVTVFVYLIGFMGRGRIFTYNEWLIFMENVGKYIPYMDAMGTLGITFR